MAFFKFRQNGESTTPTTRPAESVEVMRQRAKHRLIGAAVLVLIGVVGFPMLFDTQPRPIPVDVQIDIPDRNKVAPLQIPAASAPTSPVSPAAPAASVAPEPAAPVAPARSGKLDAAPSAPARTLSVKPPVAEETRVAAGASLDNSEQLVTPEPSKNPLVAPIAKASGAIGNEAKPAPKPEAKPLPKPEAKPEPKVEAKPAPAKTEAKPEHKAEPKAEAKPEHKPDEAARAKALLEGKEPGKAQAEEARFVIQVGAFADAAKARETRQKLEKAGLKTYTHVAETKDGQRIRVRVGPFASKAEAEKVAGKVKHLSLPAAILTL